MAEEQGEVAIVSCGTTKGEIELELHRDWSPNGYDRAVQLFEKGFYDYSHFFRVVPNFLCQFGISYTGDPKLKELGKTPIQDDPKLENTKFEIGTISYAGSGPNSRTSHLFFAFVDSPGFGTQLWETPIGRVKAGMDKIHQFYSYGDMPPWGEGPEQQPIYDGPEYIEKKFPLTDKFLTCSVERVLGSESSLESISDGEDEDEASEAERAKERVLAQHEARLLARREREKDAVGEDAKLESGHQSPSLLVPLGIVAVVCLFGIAIRSWSRSRQTKRAKST